MKKVAGFLAYDGKFFKTEDECLTHEENIIKTYDDKGYTSSINDCLVVALRNDNEVSKFLEKSSAGHYTVDGVVGTGIYFWDGAECIYRKLTGETLNEVDAGTAKAFTHLFHDLW